MKKQISTFISEQTDKDLNFIINETHQTKYHVTQKIIEEGVKNLRNTTKNQNGLSTGETGSASQVKGIKGFTHNPGTGELEE